MYDLGVYVPRQSPVHDLDPRAKILAVLVLSIVVFRVGIPELVIIAIGTFLTALIARTGLTSLVKALRPVWFFFVILFMLYVFFTAGHPLPGFPVGPVTATFEGLIIGILQVSKFMVLILLASLLTMTTSSSELTVGAERLIRPLKILGISSHDTATMISLALRFIPVFLDEANSIREAQLARGAGLSTHGISGRIKFIINLAAPLAISVIRHADQLVDAMEARGYETGYRTYLNELTFSAADYLVVLGSLAVLVISLV